MTTHSIGRKPVRGRRRLSSALAYDGAIAMTLLKSFQFFLVSVSFIGAVAPAILFTLLVGWQPTHLSIWLGAASLLTSVPAAYGLLAAAQRELIVPGELRAGREFWRSFRFACRRLWWLAAAVAALAAVLGYDIAILGAGDVVLLAIFGAGLIAVLLTVSVLCVTIATGRTSPAWLIPAAVRAMMLRPHVALSWGMLIVLGVLLTTVPLIGPGATLFAPAGVAVGIVICNTALGFARYSEESRS